MITSTQQTTRYLVHAIAAVVPLMLFMATLLTAPIGQVPPAAYVCLVVATVGLVLVGRTPVDVDAGPAQPDRDALITQLVHTLAAVIITAGLAAVAGTLVTDLAAGFGAGAVGAAVALTASHWHWRRTLLAAAATDSSTVWPTAS